MSTVARNIVLAHHATGILQIAATEDLSPWESLLNNDEIFPQLSESVIHSSGITWLTDLGMRLDSGSGAWESVLGLKRFAHGDFHGAGEAYDWAARAGRDKAGIIHFISGATYELGGERSEALRVWREAPATARFFVRRGNEELYAKSDPAEALGYFLLATEIDPTQCEPRYRLGITWVALGDPEKAWLSLSDVEDISCTSIFMGEIHYQRAKLLASRGSVVKAAAEARRSLDFGRKPARLLLLGNLLLRLENDFDEAHAVFIEALGIAPERISPYLSLCQLERVRTNYQQAIDWCVLAAERFPEDANAYLYAGRVYLAMKGFEEAIRWLETAASLNDSGANIWTNLGDAYRGAREYDRALPAYQKALELDATNAYVQQRVDELRDR